MVAFEALEVMRERAPAGEEAVYRSLISACGRCGNSEKAMAVVEVELFFKFLLLLLNKRIILLRVPLVFADNASVD